MVVAIDGPAGSGKGTVTKLIAEKLNLVYIDTGATYRCVALAAIRNGIKLEEKDTLLKYLCMALPYHVLVHSRAGGNDYELREVNVYSGSFGGTCAIPIPYLRPMLSMTDEEKEEMHNLLSPEGTAIYGCGGISMPMNHYGEFVPYEFMNRIIQYLLKNHFDFMGLIPKDLAIEVTENNNPYK